MLAALIPPMTTVFLKSSPPAPSEALIACTALPPKGGTSDQEGQLGVLLGALDQGWHTPAQGQVRPASEEQFLHVKMVG